MASNVPSSIAIGTIVTTICGSCHKKYSTAATSGACSSETSRLIARMLVAAKIKVNAESPNANGPDNSETM